MKNQPKKCGFKPLEKTPSARPVRNTTFTKVYSKISNGGKGRGRGENRLPGRRLNLLPKFLTGFTLIEILLVMGIFTIITGACLTLLSTGRVSVNIADTQSQTEESARQAMNRISKELRLSQAGRVSISNNLGSATSNTSGSVINFQVPVGCYETLDLTDTYELKWGTENTQNAHISYSLDGNSRLLRSTYTAEDASDATSRIIAQNISSLNFSRSVISSSLINIVIVAQSGTASNTAPQILRSSIRLRN